MEIPESNRPEYKTICPHLGLADDHTSRFAYPETAHRCFATQPASPIVLEHQSAFCFTPRCHACPRFVELAPEAISGRPLPSPGTGSERQRLAGVSIWRTFLWGLASLLAGLLVIFGILYYSSLTFQQSAVTPLANQVVPSPTISLTATPTPAASVTSATLTPHVIANLPELTVTPTPVAGGHIFALSPTTGDAGWLTGNEDKGNHFGDSYLYAGIFKGQVYISAFQFDLRAIPRGAPIVSASLQLTGLRDDRLGIHVDQSSEGAAWSLRLLDSEIDQNWRRHNFQDIFNVSVLQTLSPILSVQDLEVGRSNIFELSSAQIKILETRIVEDENPRISFRIEGPMVGPDNLFAWDTGYGPESQGNRITLLLNVGPPPATPPPYDYVVVTSTPTPENVVTAAAMVRQVTAEATRIGTTTPVPPNMVTATPIPDYLIIVPTPTPENVATAQALGILATAEALTTGTPTPIPTNAVTATPLPTPTSLFNLSGSSGPVTYVLITSTPTPQSVFAAATLSAVATAQARSGNLPTPLPANWVTPVVVTATPIPVNAATAQALVELEKAIAITTGTPTPTPPNMVTATPTPAYDLIPYLLTPPATRIPTVVPSLPAALLGKILFSSDREAYGQAQSLSADEYTQRTGLTAPPLGTIVLVPDPVTNELQEYVIRPQTDVYVFDPKTGELGRLNATWPYETARKRDTYSADTVYQAYVKQLLWTNVQDSQTGKILPTTEFAIHAYDYKYKVEKIVTKMGSGIVYDPSWSPVSNQIAFVATESGNDEIWVINADGTNPVQITHNTWEWDKSPSWSPDGKQMVFMSNRTGNQQLWIMNADGSDQRLLMGWDHWTPYNDWGPVWVKYLDPAPPEDKER